MHMFRIANHHKTVFLEHVCKSDLPCTLTSVLVIWLYNVCPMCVQQEDGSADLTDTVSLTVPPAVPVLDSAMLLDVEPVFKENLAELLDGLGVFNC